MDNGGLPQAPEDLTISSEQLSEFSAAPVDDIPEAVRETVHPESQSFLKRNPMLWGLGGVGAIALIVLPFVFFKAPSSSISAESAEPLTGDRSESSSEPINATNSPDALLGHLLYEEAPASELEPVTADGSIVLRQAAAEKFLEMVDAAAADGVNLVPLSGFRSIDEQDDVFFDVKAERGQGATTRAEVSAPPGYSEHHTGYAIDIGDEYYPDADLKTSFENTSAFKWLQENAAYYSFELSFPKGNPQGVSYEPWHWRFVGDRDSLETFYRARSAARNSSENVLENSSEDSPQPNLESEDEDAER